MIIKNAATGIVTGVLAHNHFPCLHGLSNITPEDLQRIGSRFSPQFAFYKSTTQWEVLCLDGFVTVTKSLQDTGEWWCSRVQGFNSALQHINTGVRSFKHKISKHLNGFLLCMWHHFVIFVFLCFVFCFASVARKLQGHLLSVWYNKRKEAVN